MKKATRPIEQSRSHEANGNTGQSKISRLLAHLLTGASINRFEAERLGDHCLPSTIAALANRYQLDIKRETENVPNRFGGLTRVNRYSLAESEQDKAGRVLVRLTKVAGSDQHAS